MKEWLIWPNDLAQLMIALTGATGEAQGGVILTSIAVWFVLVACPFVGACVGMAKYMGWFDDDHNT